MDKKENKISIEDFVVITTTATLHKLFSYKYGSEAISLYMFYYYTAKWQKTNQIKATTDYCMKGLNWGRSKFSRAKKILAETNLIEDITIKDDEGKISGWYIKINFIWKINKTNQVVDTLLNKKTTLAKNNRVEKQHTNALSKNKVNALNKDIVSIFEYWNKKDIIKHRKLVSKMKTKIRSALKDYKVEEIKEAIDNYNKVLKGKDYWWTYKWTLIDFISRGLTKFLETPIKEFSNIKQNKNNFNKKKQAYWQGNRVVEKNGKKYVISQDGDFLEFNGDEKDIKYK